jgi:hypothetical protein
MIILSPIFIVFYLLFIVLWILFTLTGIGPICQWYYQRKDSQLLDRNRLVNEMPDFQLLTIPKGIHSAASKTLRSSSSAPLSHETFLSSSPLVG